MAENEDPLYTPLLPCSYVHVQNEHSSCARRNLEQSCRSLTLSIPSLTDRASSYPVGHFESCRFKSSRVGRDSTYCEIVQKRITNPFHRQRDNKLSLYPGKKSIYIHAGCSLAYRKRLQNSQCCSRRHKQVSLYPADLRGYRRRRHTTQAQRKAANVREQKRMMNLKDAFKSLRACLPTLSYEKKMSRIDTLRLAIMYINFLKEIANGKNPEDVEWTEMKT